MFRLDDDVDGNRTVIRFSYEQFDDKGNQTSYLTRTIRNDDAEYLPSILEAFMFFLQGMTFTYVDDIVVVHESGKETSANEL
jgi:hypothetical protein